MRRIVSSVFLLMMFLVSSSLAQVRILERVLIDSRPPKIVQSASGGNMSLVVTFSFTGSIRPDMPRFLRATNCATDQFVDPMSTSATISIPARSGRNTTVARWSIPAGTSGTAKLKIEADGVVLREDTIAVNCFCTLQMNPEVFLQSGVKLTLPGSITHGQSAPIGMTNAPFTSCSNTVWHPNMRTTITIAQGASFGSFYDENGNRLGTSATGNQFELSKVRFVADGDQPEGGKGTLTLEASSQGVTIGSTDVEIEASSTPPVIDSVRTATGKLSFPVGSTVALQGYFHDLDSDVANATWSLVNAPISSSNSSDGNPSVVASSVNNVTSPESQSFPLDLEGFYLFRFTVMDAGGNTRTKDLYIEAIGLDHFDITLEKDEIAFTETSRIFVQAKDKDNNDVDLDGDSRLIFSLKGESAYGTFIKPNGDTVKTFPTEAGGITYSDAQARKVVFAAVAANPETIGKPKIVVALESDLSKDGEKEITVLEQHLKIVMLGPKQIMPILPNTILIIPPGSSNPFSTKFKVRSTLRGQPVGQQPFELSNDHVIGSGGHEHNEPRRPNTPNNYGYFISKKDNLNHLAPLDDNTGSDGEATFEFVSSFFGDVMKIKLQSPQNPLLFDTVTIVEKVEGLKNFASVQSNMWRLTGSNGTTTYDKCPGTEIRHSGNHFASKRLFEDLQSALVDFFQWSGSSEEDGGFGTYLVLGINDMSLENGGLFDICGNWQKGHTYHRIGASVDIDKNSLGFFSPANEFDLKTRTAPDGRTLLQHLTRIIDNHGGKKYPEEPIHYGFGGS